MELLNISYTIFFNFSIFLGIFMLILAGAINGDYFITPMILLIFFMIISYILSLIFTEEVVFYVLVPLSPYITIIILSLLLAKDE